MNYIVLIRKGFFIKCYRYDRESQMKGSFSFIVRDENIDFEEISKRLDLSPPSIIKKGQYIRDGGRTKAL
ncbi:hypothetical protein BSK59_06585 [Paenibacillus odorifer]|nr:hypothetical protein BJP46_18555 [Paenibacillus odorifer]OME59921.1 hypothetical protein BSK59_06585 [Paenibacillus odorifer]